MGRELADKALGELLAEPAEQLARCLPPDPRGRRIALDHLVALSGEVESDEQLAEMTLVKSQGLGSFSESQRQRLAAAIAAGEARVLQAMPDLVNQLTTRGGPLRQHWEARGPGMLNFLERITEPKLLVDRADVILVHPVLGGGGGAHLLYNTARIEALVANPHESLPETVRLAWLLAQLHADLPAYAEGISGDRLPAVAELAMVCPILTAAEQVELARFDDVTLALALRAWPAHSSDHPQILDVVQRWWETCRASRPAWPVGLAALDEMLGDLVHD